MCHANRRGADGNRDGSRTVRFEDHDVMRLLAGHDDEAAKRFFANHLFAAERAQQVTNVELRAAEILRRGSAAGLLDADTGQICAPSARESRRAGLIAALPGSQMCLRCGFGPLICSTDTSCTRCCFDGSSAGIDTKEEEEDHAARRWIMPWDGRLPHVTDACDVTNGNDLLIRVSRKIALSTRKIFPPGL